MYEHIEFMIDGIGPQTILGPEEYENADTLCHLGYLIFVSLREGNDYMAPEWQQMYSI